MTMKLPCCLGNQAAEKPPRYVAVSRVRQAMQSAKIEARPVGEVDATGGLAPSRMFQPEPSERATILDGDVEHVAEKLVEILRDAGVM